MEIRSTILKFVSFGYWQDNTAKDLLLLWTHEMTAGYSYRMINTVDKERFQQTFAMSAKKHFGKEDYVSRIILCWDDYSI